METQAGGELESLQSLLANASAIQESGINPEVLSVFVEVQRQIAKSAFDVDHALGLVSQCVRKLANAAGVAIALLKGDQLVYRAGNGSATQYVGRHLPAVLTVSTHKQFNEILRVENADTDRRIEAEVTRQFGARALLIVPIYREHVVAGVLQVLFNDAHKFQDQELRAYRLMAGLVKEVIFPSQINATSPRTATVPHAIKEISSQIPMSRGDHQSVQVLVERPRIGSPSGKAAALALVQFLDPLAKVWTAGTHAVKRTLFGIPWNGGTWKMAAAGGMVLLIASWFAFDHRPPSSMRFPQRGANLAPQQVPPIAAKPSPRPLPLNPRMAVTGTEATNPPTSAYKSARVGQNDAHHIAEDVTVRYFGRSPKSGQVLTSVKVVDFGDDVTIRYFTYTPRPVPRPRSGSKTPSVSE